MAGLYAGHSGGQPGRGSGAEPVEVGWGRLIVFRQAEQRLQPRMGPAHVGAEHGLGHRVVGLGPADMNVGLAQPL